MFRLPHPFDPSPARPGSHAMAGALADGVRAPMAPVDICSLRTQDRYAAGAATSDAC